MVLCAAKKCFNRSSHKSVLPIKLEVDRKITFHRFPKDVKIRQIWLKNMGLTEALLPTTPFLCSMHFAEDAFDRTSVNRIQLKPNSIPQDRMEVETQCDDPTDSPLLQGVYDISKEKCKTVRKRLRMEEVPSDLSMEENADVSSKQHKVDEISDDSEKAFNSAPTLSVNEFNAEQTSRSTSISPDHFGSPTKVQMIDKGTSVSPRLHFNSPRKCQLRSMLREQSQTHSKEVKLLKQKCERGEKRIATLEHVLDELRRKNLLQDENFDVLKNIGGINKDLLKRISNKSNDKPVPKTYSSQLRTFALALHYYSPRAYEYVREKFDSCLPHSETLSRWYRSINGDPGFNTEAFACIKQRAQSSPHPLLGTLIFDEMSIKQHIEYDGKKFCGYTDLGREIDCEAQSVAKGAFVFMFVCMNGAWKIPVGYFLINGINAEQKSNLVKQCLHLLHEACVTVKCLTFDGAPVNLTSAKILGCNLNDPNCLQPWFPHPVTQGMIYVFPDPCHMLKLIRNTLGNLRCFTNGSGLCILWKYIQDLHEMQEKEGLHLGNKLRQGHIDYHKRKMKVRFAAQIFSESVADALEVCDKQLGLPQFKNCTATCEFVNIVNDIFDIFNSKNVRAYGYKKAINRGNSDIIIQKLNEYKEYILGLKVADRRIVDTRNRTGFVGFIMCIESLKALFDEVCITNNQLQYFLTYKLSQDHLELFCGCLRARGGHNNNPTARQFKSAFKKILIHTELRETSTGNCIALESISILHVTSRMSSEEIINLSTPATRMIDSTINSHTNVTDHDYVPADV